MTEPNPYQQPVQPLSSLQPHRDIFDELNLPADVAAFLRANMGAIKIGAIVLAVLLVGWSGYDYYATTRTEQSSALLASALHEQDDANQKKMLTEVVGNYSGTDAARWARLELAHIDEKAANFADAAEQYRQVLAGLDEESPIAPLVHYALAQALEQNKEPDQAVAQYQKLAQAVPYADIAYLAQARIYENKGETDKAREAYERVGNDSAAWAKDRLAKLGEPHTKATE